jgi:hypothetical protein
MRYTVVWESVAESQLVTLWTNSANRSAITAAADEIDRLLRTNPHEKGESRSGSARVLLVEPLGVLFEARDADRIVSVFSVWYYAPQP